MEDFRSLLPFPIKNNRVGVYKICYVLCGYILVGSISVDVEHVLLDFFYTAGLNDAIHSFTVSERLNLQSSSLLSLLYLFCLSQVDTRSTSICRSSRFNNPNTLLKAQRKRWQQNRFISFHSSLFPQVCIYFYNHITINNVKHFCTF